MGSQPSKAPHILTCPDGYDEKNFKAICQLFDRLDADSDMGVGVNEINSIAEKFLERRKQQLRASQDTLRNERKCDMEKHDAEYQRKVEAAAAVRDAEKTKSAVVYSRQIDALGDRVKAIDNLDGTQKSRTFMRIVSGDENGNLSFWKFFEAVKNEPALFR